VRGRRGSESRTKKANFLIFNQHEEVTMIFHVTLEKAEDGWIVVECPALPGCVSQGKDEKEALENIKEAITAWLWAEDQKAVSALPQQVGSQPIVVAV
jgi:predicted RNase H-like HicB family nuclease